MQKFITFDCETDPFKFGRVPEPFIWGAYDGEKFYKFYDTAGFVDWLSKKKVIAYAHNGGKFDAYFLLDYIKEEQKKIMIINGRLAKIKIGECEIRDSYLNLPVKLADYQKDDIDYKKFEKEVREKHLPEIEKYLQGDCVYLYELLEDNFETFGHKLTLAGTAYAYWNKYFNKDKINTLSGESYFKKFNPFYYGGRVQCFKKGIIDKPFKMYDINSAYPYAMQFEHMAEFDYIYDTDFRDDLEMTLGLFEVECIANGCFPFREKSGLSFPNDDYKRIYFITGWELKVALKLNLVKELKCINAYYWTKSLNFKDYVEFFYLMKKNAKINKNKSKYLLSKLYMNSLYGKFGQNPEKFKEYRAIENERLGDFCEENPEFDFLTQLNSDMTLIERPAGDFSKSWYNVATACSVTGFVRAYMLEHLHKAQGLMYCDTDSIACESLDCEMSETELGKWGLEGNFESGAIAGKKMYAFKYAGEEKFKISTKGVRLNAEEIIRVAKGETITYKQDAPTFSFNKINLMKNKSERNKLFLQREVKLT